MIICFVEFPYIYGLFDGLALALCIACLAYLLSTRTNLAPAKVLFWAILPTVIIFSFLLGKMPIISTFAWGFFQSKAEIRERYFSDQAARRALK
jgi:hypothetical protein